MPNKKWKQFDQLSHKCYLNLMEAEKDNDCWLKAFELVKEIALVERKNHPKSALSLEALDEMTDYEYDIQGWMEDCLDEFELLDGYETLLKMCDDLLELFDCDSDIKFRKANALCELHQTEEAIAFCENWLKQEPENITAATATVYALIAAKEYDKAETLVDQFITDKSEISDENEIMFIAASKLYEAMNQKKKKKEIDLVIEKYDEDVDDILSFLFDVDVDEDEDDGYPF